MSKSNKNPYYRIEAILELYCLSANAFAKKIGIGKTELLYNIRDGKVKTISADLCFKITEVFSAIDPNWLLTGQGRFPRSCKGRCSPDDNTKHKKRPL